ncbi:MAG TPA: hypothetical protein VFC51_15385 [Chloroflexota bacterium]|nr:hypothetical protein [Chloroflexota bacterium]
MVSPLRFQVADGHVFAQPALSDYFAALASTSEGQAPGLEGSVSLPVRVFDPATLVTTRGTSVLGEMMHRVDYLVIEDADLRPRALLAHLRRFDVSDIVVFAMTSTMRLTGNYAYVPLRRGDLLPRLEGDRLA